MQDVFFFAPPGSNHDEHAPGHSRVAQGHSLIGGSDTEPAAAFQLKRASAFGVAVAVSIAFHDRADGDGRTDMALQFAKIVPQSRERDLSPIRTGVDARKYRLGEQFTSS